METQLLAAAASPATERIINFFHNAELYSMSSFSQTDTWNKYKLILIRQVTTEVVQYFRKTERLQAGKWNESFL